MATGLLFSGQGAQHIGMGRSLCEHSNTAAAIYDQANAVTDPLPPPMFRHWGWFVLALLAIIAAESLRFL